MWGSGLNLVTTVIGFGMSAAFIVFVCTRLLCGRIRPADSRSTPLNLELRSDIDQVRRSSGRTVAFVASVTWVLCLVSWILFWYELWSATAVWYMFREEMWYWICRFDLPDIERTYQGKFPRDSPKVGNFLTDTPTPSFKKKIFFDRSKYARMQYQIVQATYRYSFFCISCLGRSSRWLIQITLMDLIKHVKQKENHISLGSSSFSIHPNW